MTKTPDESAHWQARAAAWELLALSLRYPDTVLTQAWASGEWAAAARELASTLGLTLPEDFGKETAGESNLPEVLHGLRVEHTRLFVGAPDALISPYEGDWRASDDGVAALSFVNPHTRAVLRFMRACGLTTAGAANEPADSASNECELLQYLCALAAQQDTVAASFPTGSAAGAYAQFIEEHAAVWLPRFAAKTQREARHPLFGATAALMQAMLR